MAIKKFAAALLIASSLATTAMALELRGAGNALIPLPYRGDLNTKSHRLSRQDMESFTGRQANKPDLNNSRYDCFRLHITEAGEYEITMRRHQQGLGDPYLMLLTANRHVLAEDDDSGRIQGQPNTLLDAKIRIRLQPGDYYVIATTFRADDMGYYDLNVTRVGP